MSSCSIHSTYSDYQLLINEDVSRQETIQSSERNNACKASIYCEEKLIKKEEEIKLVYMIWELQNDEKRVFTELQELKLH